MSEIPSTAIAAVFDALHFAAAKHCDQRRKGHRGEPYVNHLIEVASLLAHASDSIDLDQLIAALLHDTVEDTDTTPDEITARFGAVVTGLVLEVTDDKRLPKRERKELQITSAPKKSPRAKEIKVADKISNLRSILSSPPSDWSIARKREYFDWAKAVVDACGPVNPVLRAEFDRVYDSFSTEPSCQPA